MLAKRLIVSMVSIAVICFLMGTTVNFVATASDGNPFDKIWQAIYDLQARVTSLEESVKPKTWHFVTSFMLSYDGDRVSPLFFIQGQKWRIRWEPQQIQSWYGFIIWDENGFAIEWVDVTAILMEHHEAKGIQYVPNGEGSYYIECLSGPSVNFTIESYY